MGSHNVYYQPPASVKMKYPCIVFSKEDIKMTYADDHPYQKGKKYKITHISRTPDDPVLDDISNLSQCSFDRHYVVDNLHHDVYNIFF